MTAITINGESFVTVINNDVVEYVSVGFVGPQGPQGPPGIGSLSALSDLLDVDIDNPVAKSTLLYDTLSSTWKANPDTSLDEILNGGNF